MVGLGFPEMNKKKKDKDKKKKKMRLGLRDGHHHHHHHHHHHRHDESPDSVIFTTTTTTDESSNLSLFSSGCGSVVDRRSFASSDQFHDSLVSELSKHLAVERDVNECSSSPDLDSNIFAVQTNNCTIMMRNEEKVEVLEEEDEEEEGEDCQALDPAKSSFSLAIRECQNRRYTHEAVTVQKKPDRHRPVSLDLNNGGNNVNSSSPRHRGMRKSSVSSGRLDTFLSPGRSNYWQGSVGVQKGWSSERVPLPTNGGRRNVNASFLPFNHGRTLPSKWEDAEKWICSPVGGDGPSCSPMPLPHRRPKSKSGPLGQPTVTYHPAYSPSIPTLEGVSVGTYTAGSPFSTGVLAANALPSRGHCRDSSSSSSGDGSRGSGGRTYAVHRDSCIVRSASIHGWSTGVLVQPSLPGSKDEKQDVSKDAVTMKSRAVSKRDIATQMSPECSTRPSPKRTAFLSPSHPTSLLPIVELQSHPSKLEVRDVQVDDRVVVTRWSHRHGPLVSQKGFTDVKECKKKDSKTEFSAWEVAETAKSKREEARITAWENLQKAKAEAAIRKLEMLEQLVLLDHLLISLCIKIMNKLRSAQKKAQDMRSTVSVSSSQPTHQVAKVSKKKAMVSLRKSGQRSSLSGCFTCHAF